MLRSLGWRELTALFGEGRAHNSVQVGPGLLSVLLRKRPVPNSRQTQSLVAKLSLGLPASKGINGNDSQNHWVSIER